MAPRSPDKDHRAAARIKAAAQVKFSSDTGTEKKGHLLEAGATLAATDKNERKRGVTARAKTES
ncbi:hypothetical protein [uncultured Enterococcus sp.]|uniref:hypothetical protein n=1 Tax=uncultured Enterococcus sp. TaxID=167972 RepID=UPI0028064732|nr:hypothetical protein [uncultured Enterococcus sp.]